MNEAKPTKDLTSALNVLFLENIHASATEVFQQDTQGSGNSNSNRARRLGVGGIRFNIERLSKALPAAELCQRLADVHILGIRSKTRISAEVLAAAPNLLGIGCFCIGTNQVDLDAANRRGVPVWNAPFSNTRSVAEMILAEIIMLARQLGDRSREVHGGTFRKVALGCNEVRGKTLGIVGYGHIGSQVGLLAESLGMRVLYYDTATKLALGNCQSCPSLEPLLEQSDFVTLHVPATPQTSGMIGAAELARMKKGSYLLNASRGTVVDIEALAAARKNGHLRGAAIDVFPEEPEENSEGFLTPLQGLPNIILTPHIGGSTEEAQANIGREVAASLVRFITQGATTGAVNFPGIELAPTTGTYRLLNVHQNVPGVLRDVNRVVSELGANIHSQILSTDSNIGYLIMDLDEDVSHAVLDRLRDLRTSIRTRILY